MNKSEEELKRRAEMAPVSEERRKMILRNRKARGGFKSNEQRKAVMKLLALRRRGTNVTPALLNAMKSNKKKSMMPRS